MKFKYILNVAALGALLALSACSEDFLETKSEEYIDEESVQEVMQDDPSQVQAFVTGAYSTLYDGGQYVTTQDEMGHRTLMLVSDMMAEDIAYYQDVHYMLFEYQMTTGLLNSRRSIQTWRQLYTVIDNVNTIITMLKPEEGEQPADRQAKIMLGEAYSLRAYCYFWLINMYQHPLSQGGANKLGVPLKTDTEYRMERVPVGEVYQQILSDIEAGYNYLKGEGYHNGKVSVSEYAAAAIYARILMFTGDYAEAAAYAERAIAGGSLNSNAELLSGFNSINLPEVLWGYGVTEETSNFFGSYMSMVDTYSPGYGGAYRKMIASDLYSKIADNDIRKQWFGFKPEFDPDGDVSYTYENNLGFADYLQSKHIDVYNTSGGSASAFTSDYIYMRSAEMYFVAAEAYYLDGNEASARASLNAIVSARIPGYNFAGSGTALYEEICLQKRIETWMDGVRLFDIKRRGETVDRTTSVNHALDLVVLNAMKYEYNDPRMIYQIPTIELENNPAITADDQNPR